MRVLQLSTYPARIPRHGGQARVAHIAETLRKEGHQVRTLAVYEPEIYGGNAVGEDDIALPAESPFRRGAPPLCTDLASGDFLAHDENAYRRFVRVVEGFAPDIVTVEQTFLWPAIERLRRENPDCRFSVVNSSHNIEAPLKREVLREVATEEVDAVVARIEAVERAAAQGAELTIAVTESDADVLRSYGAPRVIVAHNGINERVVEEKQLHDWKWFLGERRYALFVGSAYPPNARGFWDIFVPSLAFLAPDQRILVVGGICGILRDDARCKRWEGVNASRLDLAGFQPENTLGTLLNLATCIILPITQGGGSNIKTAEAIFSGKPIIGTSKSFRGYERYLALPHVYSTDDPTEFKRITKVALDGALPTCGPDDPALRASVLWRHTLAGIPEAFAELRQRR